MIKIKIKIFTLVLVFSSFAFAEDPFSRSFSSPSNVSSSTSDMSLTSSSNPEDNIHPLVRFDPTKYFVKGVITSAKGSIVIVSLPGYTDFFVFRGDPLGNDLHTIRDISQDFIILGNSKGNEISIPVSNLAQTATMGGIQ